MLGILADKLFSLAPLLATHHFSLQLFVVDKQELSTKLLLLAQDGYTLINNDKGHFRSGLLTLKLPYSLNSLFMTTLILCATFIIQPSGH